MHKYEELERLYYAKKRKFYIKIALLSSLIVVVLGYLLFVLLKDKPKEEVKKAPKQEVVKPKKIEKKSVVVEKNVVKKIEINNSKQQPEPKKPKSVEKIEVVKTETKKEKVKPIKPIIKKSQPLKKSPKKDEALFLPLEPKIEVKEEYKLTLKPIYPNIDKIEKKVETKKAIKPKQQPKPKVNPKKVESKKTQIHKKIVKKDEKKPILKSREVNLMALINNFENEKSYEDAIKISQILYNKGNFQKAIDWSFKANSINPSDYQSWLLYAKSLYKMNRKNKAIKVLNGYINNYGPNEQIQEFLNKIK